ncbi:hypothetical protein ACLH2F_35035 [Klebsiella grimontii]|uniref:hypothetical protein n=1 Tax=Klebsiella grimontii TaxID=2058152 RepID=UPI003983CCC8
MTQQNIPPSQECTEISDFGCRRLPAVWLLKECVTGVVSENGIYGHSRFCNTDFDDKLACLNLSGV